MDRALGIIAAIAVGCTLGVLVWWVPEVDLALVMIWAMALLVYDFWRDLRPNRNGGGG